MGGWHLKCLCHSCFGGLSKKPWFVRRRVPDTGQEICCWANPPTGGAGFCRALRRPWHARRYQSLIRAYRLLSLSHKEQTTCPTVSLVEAGRLQADRRLEHKADRLFSSPLHLFLTIDVRTHKHLYVYVEVHHVRSKHKCPLESRCFPRC